MSSDAYPGQALVEAAISLLADTRHGTAFCAAQPLPTSPSAEEERRRLIEQQAYDLSQEPGSDRQGPEKHWLLAEKRVDERLRARDQRLKDLGDAANTSATHVNASFLTFMFVWTFVALAIGGTTHEHLLRVSPVDMPLVGIKLPIVDFFAIAPYFVLLLHLNLLLQLYLLSRRLQALDAALDEVAVPLIRQVHRLKLFPLPFSHFLVGQETRPCMRMMVTVFVWVTLFLMPLLLLVAAEVRFLPYHNETVAWIQRLAVIADAGLLWLFWPLFRRRDDSPAGLQEPSVRTSTASRGWRRLRQGLSRLGFIGLVGLFPVFSTFVAVAPGEGIEVWLAKAAPSWLKVDPKQIDNGCQPTEKKSERIYSWYPAEHYLQFTCWLFDREGAWLRRNLYLQEAMLLAEKPDAAILGELTSAEPKTRALALKKVAGLGLVVRDLRFANLERAKLLKADLRGADLRGASLGETWLEQARMEPADQQNTQVTRLQGADLFGAKLQGADLSGAKLQGASLWEARLQGADLQGAQLQGASLWEARLQGADLQWAQLQGANLRWAQLQGADLSGAKLQGADLQWARLQGANLRRAEIQGADLSEAELQGANLRESHIGGAEFAGAKLHLAELRDLDRRPLTQADLDTLAESLQDLPEEIHRHILERLAARRGQTDTLEWAEDTRVVLCKPGAPFLDCLDPEDLEARRLYTDQLADYLTCLACTKEAGPFVRLGLLRQLMDRSHRIQGLVEKLGPRLLAPECPRGGEKFPDWLQKREVELEGDLRKQLADMGISVPDASSGAHPNAIEPTSAKP